MQKVKMICKPAKTPEEGCLCVAESESTSVPFEIKRIYYSYGIAKGITRGMHAHKNLKQILICIHGRIKISLNDGHRNESIIMSNPSEGIYVGPNIWRTMEWLEQGSVLLVLASEHYDESDYIRDYGEFIEWLKAKGEKDESTL